MSSAQPADRKTTDGRQPAKDAYVLTCSSICLLRRRRAINRPFLDSSHRGAKTAARDLAPLQSRTDSEVISPTAIAGGNTGLVLCQVSGQ